MIGAQFSQETQPLSQKKASAMTFRFRQRGPASSEPGSGR